VSNPQSESPLVSPSDSGGSQPLARASSTDGLLLPPRPPRILTVPNLITACRLILIPFFAVVFLSGERDILAFTLLALIGFSDFLDGFIARRTGQVTELGKVLDPLADRLAVITVLGVFVFRGTLPWQLALIILGRDVVVLIIFGVLEKKGYPRIPVNRTGKAATAAIFTGMAVAALNLAMGDSGSLRAASILFLVAGAVLYWVAVLFYGIEIRRLVRARGNQTGSVA